MTRSATHRSRVLRAAVLASATTCASAAAVHPSAALDSLALQTQQVPYVGHNVTSLVGISAGILGAVATTCSSDKLMHAANKRMVEGLHRKCETTPGLRIVINAFDAIKGDQLDGASEAALIKGEGLSKVCKHPAALQLPALPKCVIGISRVKGFKMRFFKWVLKPSLTDHFAAVWMFDNDLDVDGPRFDIGANVKRIMKAGAGITQPLVHMESTPHVGSGLALNSVGKTSGDEYGALHLPLKAPCEVQSAIWIENQTPVIQSKAWHVVWKQMVSKLDDNLFIDTDWGPDGRWCRLLEIEREACFPTATASCLFKEQLEYIPYACAVTKDVIRVHDADTIANGKGLGGKVGKREMGKRVKSYMSKHFPQYARYADGRRITSQINQGDKRGNCVLPPLKKPW